MSKLANTTIEITDDSAYATGIETLIPLYVFATEQDKVIDETTGEIAIGTTKGLANQVSIVTSKKDVIDKFGMPKFAESNGTVLQNDERNEHGLYALFDAMGSTSLAYALRADIDLKALESKEEEPTSNVKNGTYWLDMYNTTLGFFRCDNPTARQAQAWTRIEGIQLFDHTPAASEGNDGDFAVYYNEGVQTTYEKVSGTWVVLGTGKTVYHQSAIQYPERIADAIWVKTTPVNNGAEYSLKKWVESAGRWYDQECPVAISDADATKLYGDAIEDGCMAIVCDTTTTSATLKQYVGGTWSTYKTAKITMTEPREIASEGTLWFNDDLKVDIMVNNGTVWQGYKVAFPNASIYVTSEEPTVGLVNDDLWIDTNSIEYPAIKKYVEGFWTLVNNTDQTTPDGVVFADARYFADFDEPTYSVDKTTGKVTSNLLTKSMVDPDCPNPQTYPAGMLLFNTRFSTNNVKEFKTKPFEGLYTYEDNAYTYTVGAKFTVSEANKDFFTNRWVSASGNAADGSGLFGKAAQRKMVVNALAGAIKSNEDIRTFDYDFFFATCPGYPEVDDELISLNKEKKEMFEIVTDTPKTLKPNGKDIQEWGTNANNAVSHGTEGRVLKNEYVTRQYPPMGLTSNVDGTEIAVPTSVAKMKNLLVLPRGQIAAGTQNGQVTNLASVGYITDEEEYASVVVNDGLGDIITAQSMNPIMPKRNTGLLFWGENTENPITSSLSDEHAIITLLRLKRQLEAACLPFFFRINNESLRNEFHKVLQGILDTFIGTGEIYDYALEVESQNTNETINRKELWAAVAIEIAKGVEQIYIPIRVVATGALSD